MRRHPKASSADSSMGNGSSRRPFVSAFATRDASLRADGSGARSRRRRADTALVLLVATILFGLFPLAAQATVLGKLAEIGLPSGGLGGQLNAPQGIAVNRTGAGGVSAGDFYVADRVNHRIQEFSASGAFVRTFGIDVVSSATPGNVTPASSVQSIGVPASVTGGIFRLSFNGQSTGGAGAASLTEGSNVITNLIAAKGTANLTANSPTLTGLSTTIGSFRVGQPVSGTGIPAGARIINISGSALTLSANPTATASGVAISSIGPRPFAVGQVILGAGIPAGTTITAVNFAEGKLTLSANVEAGGSGSEIPIRSGLAYNATAAQTQTALQGLSTIGNGNVTVTGGPGATNPYTVTFAGALASLPVPLLAADSSELVGGSIAASITTPGKSAYEICEAGIDTCKAGINNVTAGGLQQVVSVAVDPNNGNVYATGTISRRIDVFSAKGAYQGSFGFGVRVGDTVPLGTGDTAPLGLDFCNASTGCVAGQVTGVAGLGGFAGGQGSSSESRTLAVDAAGNIYVPDSGNRRLDVFAPVLNGSNEVVGANFVKAIGGGVIPSGAEGTGTVTAGSATVSAVNTTRKAFRVGQSIIGTGIAPNTTITAVATTSLTLSQVATSAATGVGTTISVAEGPGNVSRNEKQVVTVPAGTTGGTFTLTFKVAKPSESSATTAAIPFDASAADVEAKLGALSNLGAANVAVSGATGGPYTVEFKGARFSDTNVEAMSASGVSLTPAGTPTISTEQEGTALEICTVASTCQPGAAGPAPGWFNDESPNSVAVDASNNIYTVTYRGGTVNCEAAAPCRIQKFNADGTVAASAFGPSSGGTNGCQVNYTTGVANEVQALAVAVDPTNQHVLVLRKTAASGARVCELGADGSFDDQSISPESDLLVTSGTAANQLQGPGLATGLQGRVYATQRGAAVYILGKVPPPSAKILPTTNVTATSANLRGEVTVPPGTEGIAVKYHFEYSADNGLHWLATPVPDASAGAVAGTFTKEQVVTGLQPNTSYLVRLVASTSESVTSGTEVFTTTAVPPTVTESNAVARVTPSSGKVFGTVNPNNSATTYRVEYGTTTSYGSQSPAELDPFLGSGGQAMNVSATITGLQPNTTYHWRIVATNAAGTTKGEDLQLTSAETREELNSCGLPDNRCFELVSPPDKGPGGMVTGNSASGSFQAAPNGDSAVFPYLSPAEATAGGGLMYLAKRSESGWSSTQLNPPSLVPPLLGSLLSDARGFVKFHSPDLSCSVVQTYNPITEDVPSVHVEFGVRNLFSRDAGGTYRLLTPSTPLNILKWAESPIPNGSFATIYNTVYGSSPDCGRVYFSSLYDYPGTSSGLYETDGGIVRDAALRPDGSIPPRPPGGQATFGATGNAVSEDGSKLFFTTLSSEGGNSGKTAVFLREGPDVEDVTDVTVKQGGANDSRGSRFELATKDGGRVFFISTYGLTPASSSGVAEACDVFTAGDPKRCDLYAYDTAAGSLVDLSADSSPTNTNGAAVQRVLAASEDGELVYFTAMGQLIPGKGQSFAENNSGGKWVNVYLSEEGSLRYVSTVAATEPSNTSATPDGRGLLFVSARDLTGEESGGHSQAYLYSADTGAVQCVSCRRDGQPGNADVFSPHLSDDASRVFFGSGETLAPGAEKEHRNIYEWKRGQVFLLVAGQGIEAANSKEVLYGASGTGDDVFIGSTARLDLHDVDNVSDLYDARVAGGFAPPPPPPPACDPITRDDCQGIPLPEPASLGSASGGAGPGNPPTVKPKPRPRTCRNGTVRRHGKCVKRNRHKRTAGNNRGGVK